MAKRANGKGSGSNGNGATHAKISDHRPAGCHTDRAVSTLTPLPPARPVMPAAVPSAGAGNRALGILLDDPGAGRPVHVEHIPARAGREVPWPPWVPAFCASRRSP